MKIRVVIKQRMPPQRKPDVVILPWYRLTKYQERCSLYLVSSLNSMYGTDGWEGRAWIEYQPHRQANAADDEDSFAYLQGGTVRRPTIAELAALTDGKAPWEGVVF